MNAGPRHRFTANGLIVSNCKEGFNDPPTSCVAVFRPVSKRAASLAEQMKGRASRPLPGIIEGLATAEERLEAIRNSAKPDALIIDMVGISGLGDCASTLQIYAEGYSDAVVAKAQEILLAGGMPNVMDALSEAEKEVEAERQADRQRQAALRKAAQEREAQRRAEFDAQARYTVHSSGVSRTVVSEATEGQLKFLHMLGIDFTGIMPSKAQAGRMISLIKQDGKTPADAAMLTGIRDDEWKPARATLKQIAALARRGIDASTMTPAQASAAFNNGSASRQDFAHAVRSASTHAQLTAVARSIAAAKSQLPAAEFAALVELGRQRRDELTSPTDFPFGANVAQ